jgi:mandelate racemase
MSSPAVAAAQVEQAAAAGFRAAKIRLGFPDLAADLAVVRAVRDVVGDQVQLLVDYNQALSVPEAIHRIERLDAEGLVWVEEPTRADDAAGHARIAAAVSTPIQLGENWWGPHEMARSLEVGASDLVMLDAMKIGGVSGWLRAAALAEARGLPVSSHVFVELSAHLLAVTPTAQWLEYLDLAGSILSDPVRVSDGHVAASSAPGSGIEWDEEAVARFAVT